MRKNLQNRPMSDAHIHAFVDGQLKRERGRSLQSILGDIPEKYEQLEEYQRINASLRDTLQPILEEPIPNSILVLFNGAMSSAAPAAAERTAASSAASQPTGRSRRLQRNNRDNLEQQPQNTRSNKDKPESRKNKSKQESKGGAELEMESELEYKQHQLRSFGNSLRTIPIIFIFCVISFVAGWNVRNQFQFSEERTAMFVNNALNTDSIYVGGEQEITDIHALERVFRKTFTRPILQLPNDKALQLKGGRLVPFSEEGRAVMLAYEADGQAVSLYFNQMQGLVTVEVPFCEFVNPKTVCYWHRDDMNFAVVSNLKESKLRPIAKDFLQKLLHKPKNR